MTAYLRSDSPKVSKEHSLLQFSSNKFEIGRSAGADLMLKDVNVSRKQCVFLFEDDRWTITDFSSNALDVYGVWVNSVKIRKNQPVGALAREEGEEDLLDPEEGLRQKRLDQIETLQAEVNNWKLRYRSQEEEVNNWELRYRRLPFLSPQPSSC